MVTLADIKDAHAAVAPRIHRTPILSSRTLGERVGGRCFLKPENLQKTGAFKVRGALNKVRRLSAEEKEGGLVTCSAGNHAQAVAFAATAEDTTATVVMPETAPKAKVAACRGYGAEVILHGTVFDAFERSLELARERGMTFVHPYDDPDIIAGQGTCGIEIIDDVPDVDTIVVPVGGGGLISGIAAAAKAISPRIRVIGVEPEGAAGMRLALDSGRVVDLDEVRTIADGLGAPAAGEHTLEHVRELVDDVVVISDAEIAEGLRFLLERAKLLAEPAGAAPVGALLAGKISLPDGATVVATISGGNIDASRLREILDEPARKVPA